MNTREKVRQGRAPMDAPPLREGPPEEQLLLLRFSEAVRQQLDGEWDHDTTSVDVPPVAPPSGRRSRPLLRLFVALLLFGMGSSLALSVGLLELRYRTLHHKSQLHDKLQKALSQGQAQLKKERLTLEQWEGAFRSLKHVRGPWCAAYQREPAARPAADSDSQLKSQLRKWTERWKGFLWSQLQDEYIQWRKKIWSSSTERPRPKADLCGQQPKALWDALQARLSKQNHKRLKQASRHLYNYGWCQMTWARYQHDPKHHPWLQKLRQDKCAAACKRKGAACTRCLGSWREELQLTPAQFRTYHTLVQRERARECAWWRTKKPAHQGVFHLGEYFRRVQKVLTFTSMLQRQGSCDKGCQSIQKRWGFQLELSTPTQASLYVQLWPVQARAPSKALRAWSQKPIGTTAQKQLWLPAMRPDLLGAKIPRSHWLLLHVYDHKSQRRAFVPLYPRAGKKLSLSLSLRPLRLHNDGRQPVRFASLGPPGRDDWLAFATFRLMPWEQTPGFETPYCWRGKSVPLPWRSALSAYKLNPKGQPTHRGRHHYTGQWVRGLKLSPSKGAPELLVSASSSPAGNAAPGTGKGAGLWQLSLSGNPSARQVKEITTPPLLGFVDLPLSQEKDSTLILRLACQTQQLTLMRIPASVPPRIALPPGSRLVHAAQNAKTFALLLQTGNALPRLALYSHGATTPKRSLSLPSRHQQILPTSRGFLLAGGPWGTPLRYWNGRELLTLSGADPSLRYFDPVLHPKSQRLFVVEQWKIRGRSKETASFLVSLPLSAQKPPRRRR